MSEQRPQLHERLLPRTGLDEEWAGYRAALRHNDISHLLNAGVHVEDIYRRGMVGIARMVTQDDGRWHPEERWGGTMYVTPVRVDPRSEYPHVEQPEPQRAAYRGQLIDIVAWVPGINRAFQRTGEAAVLGSSQYRVHGDREQALRVHRHPIGWLRSGGQGIVMLTQDESQQRAVLLGHRRILAESPEHREELRQVLGQNQRLAQIDVPRQMQRQERVQRQELRQEQVWGR